MPGIGITGKKSKQGRLHWRPFSPERAWQGSHCIAVLVYAAEIETRSSRIREAVVWRLT